MTPIPIRAAKEIAEKHGYDQVIVVARKVGDDGGEHVTTYGRDKAHCDVAARCGDFLKFKVMGWHRDQTVNHGMAAYQADQHEKRQRPNRWKDCPSTHCERRQECASPHECASACLKRDQ